MQSGFRLFWIYPWAEELPARGHSSSRLCPPQGQRVWGLWQLLCQFGSSPFSSSALWVRRSGHCYHPHFTDGQTEAQTGQITFQRRYSWQGAGLNLGDGWTLNLGSQGPTTCFQECGLSQLSKFLILSRRVVRLPAPFSEQTTTVGDRTALGQPWAGGSRECGGTWAGGSWWAGPHCSPRVGREGQGAEGKGQVAPELFTGGRPAGGFGASLPDTGTEPSRWEEKMRKRMFRRPPLKLGWLEGSRGRAPPGRDPSPPAAAASAQAWPGMGGVKPLRAPWHVVPPRTSGSPPPLLFFPFCLFSFLINHTLLPNLNMEMPRPGKAIIPLARQAVRAGPGLRGARRHRPLSGVCEITCTKGVSSSECVN